MGWATFWANFLQTYPVTLQTVQGDQIEQIFAHRVTVNVLGRFLLQK
jgi:hypothetical protein